MKISIITVTYNSATTIAACISSVNNQSHSEIEHIIIDGASSDNTIEIINSMPNRVTIIISEPDNGIYEAINKGIIRASGEVVGILNSDDKLYHRNSIKIIDDYFDNLKVDSIYGNIIFAGKNGEPVRSWKSCQYRKGLFEKSWAPAHPTFYCKLELYKKYGLYNTNYRIAADIELMLRFLEVNKISSFFIDEIFVKMQIGGISTKGIQSKIIITKEVMKAFKENELPFNLLKYLFYKSFKISELLAPFNEKLLKYLFP